MFGISSQRTRMNLTALALAVFSTFAGNASAAEDNAWLIGTWQLSEDKKKPGFTDDYMDFFADGAVILRDSKGIFANCKYNRSESLLVLNCVANGKEKVMSFRASPDRRTLTNRLDDIYKKIR